jgi:hypothetical protein
MKLSLSAGGHRYYKSEKEKPETFEEELSRPVVLCGFAVRRTLAFVAQVSALSEPNSSNKAFRPIFRVVLHFPFPPLAESVRVCSLGPKKATSWLVVGVVDVVVFTMRKG